MEELRKQLRDLLLQRRLLYKQDYKIYIRSIGKVNFAIATKTEELLNKMDENDG